MPFHVLLVRTMLEHDALVDAAEREGGKVGRNKYHDDGIAKGLGAIVASDGLLALFRPVPFAVARGVLTAAAVTAIDAAFARQQG